MQRPTTQPAGGAGGGGKKEQGGGKKPYYRPPSKKKKPQPSRWLWHLLLAVMVLASLASSAYYAVRWYQWNHPKEQRCPPEDDRFHDHCMEGRKVCRPKSREAHKFPGALLPHAHLTRAPARFSVRVTHSTICFRSIGRAWVAAALKRCVWPSACRATASRSKASARSRRGSLTTMPRC